jgi:hypothetical protein
MIDDEPREEPEVAGAIRAPRATTLRQLLFLILLNETEHISCNPEPPTPPTWAVSSTCSLLLLLVPYPHRGHRVTSIIIGNRLQDSIEIQLRLEQLLLLHIQRSRFVQVSPRLPSSDASHNFVSYVNHSFSSTSS